MNHEHLYRTPPERVRASADCPDIAAKLDEAEQRLADLEAQDRQISLDAALGADGAAARLADHSALLADARGKVASLKSAHAGALERDETAARANRAALQRTQMNAVKSHLAARDAASVALADAVAEAVKQFKIMSERSEKAAAANPIGGTWPAGAFCGFDELKRLLQNELFRAGGDASIGNYRSFPGAEPVPGYQQQPEKIKPLPDVLKEASAHVLKVLTGRQG